jgi:ADP-ribosylglycohydrolase
MLGSIIGDIVGSIYEFGNIKTKEFELFSMRGSYTDDSVLTIATADWILHGGDSAVYYEDWGNTYPSAGYGGGFARWLDQAAEGDYSPYGSCGNGSAMRVGPVGWAYDTEEKVLEAAKCSSECTHNHPEGIKGAQATALSIFLARKGASKEEIRKRIEDKFDYDLDFTCDGIRDTYDWGATCQDSVPQSIVAFLDGKDFEDSIRNAISLGGDSDTLGCITGSIAEAFFGIPQSIREQAWRYLDTAMQDIITEFENKYGNNII